MFKSSFKGWRSAQTNIVSLQSPRNSEKLSDRGGFKVTRTVGSERPLSQLGESPVIGRVPKVVTTGAATPHPVLLQLVCDCAHLAGLPPRQSGSGTQERASRIERYQLVR